MFGIFFYMALQDTPGSPCTFHTPVLKATVFQIALIHFIGERYWNPAHSYWAVIASMSP